MHMVSYFTSLKVCTNFSHWDIINVWKIFVMKYFPKQRLPSKLRKINVILKFSFEKTRENAISFPGANKTKFMNICIIILWKGQHGEMER